MMTTMARSFRTNVVSLLLKVRAVIALILNIRMIFHKSKP